MVYHGIMIVRIRPASFLERENHFDFSENDKMCEMGRNLRFRLIPNTLCIIIFLFHRIVRRVRTMLQTKFGEVWSCGTEVEKSVPHPIYNIFIFCIYYVYIYRKLIIDDNILFKVVQIRDCNENLLGAFK